MDKYSVKLMSRALRDLDGIYDYIAQTERPLPFFRMQDNQRIQFRGDDLIAYKTAGLPKKGRKRR